MSTSTPTEAIVYPDSDGKPMAENTLQFEWIATLVGGLDALFRDDPNVFVAGDLFWYPVEGNNKTRVAPDALVVFGRPKGHRGSYMQWVEGGIAPQVVFEVLSPGNRVGEMLRKFKFYQRFGAEEYYVLNPDPASIEGWQRVGQDLQPVQPMTGWTSPRLGVRFEPNGTSLPVLRPDGRPFATYLELTHRADRLAARLRALGIDPDA